jgi:malate dehydrogenase (oxaloacetate-decarboxylating)
LGDIGPAAALPVMEGKAMLFKEFGHIDAWPICLSTTDPDEIVRTVKALAPGFGGINLEDISSPRCFDVESRLREELDIPVFHDDQDGTAVVVLAALQNSLKIVGKSMGDIRVVISGCGAAGIACARMLLAHGVGDIIGVDRVGIVYEGRPGLTNVKEWLARQTNRKQHTGLLSDAMQGADVFIGVSAPGVLTVADLKRMNGDAIVFALANPDPEIRPEEAAPHVRILATGRSDYPNQINNVLCFPGLFRGALDVQATEINTEMKKAAAEAIAGAVGRSALSEEYIVPSVFNRGMFRDVARAVSLIDANPGPYRSLMDNGGPGRSSSRARPRFPFASQAALATCTGMCFFSAAMNACGSSTDRNSSLHFVRTSIRSCWGSLKVIFTTFTYVPTSPTAPRKLVRAPTPAHSGQLLILTSSTASSGK